jgi:hypothetical protein
LAIQAAPFLREDRFDVAYHLTDFKFVSFAFLEPEALLLDRVFLQFRPAIHRPSELSL